MKKLTGKHKNAMKKSTMEDSSEIGKGIFLKQVSLFHTLGMTYTNHPWLAKLSNQVFRPQQKYFSRGSGQPI